MAAPLACWSSGTTTGSTASPTVCLGQQADAEDLAQDICAGLARKLAGFRGEARFTTWLHSLVINAARDKLRRDSSRRRAADGWGEIETMTRASAATDRTTHTWLAEAMATLPQDLRETIALVLGEDATHAEAAAALGVSEGTVSWRMSEVRRRLRALSKEEQST